LTDTRDAAKGLGAAWDAMRGVPLPPPSNAPTSPVDAFEPGLRRLESIADAAILPYRLIVDVSGALYYGAKSVFDTKE
jgi:hypothetical protein